MSAEDHPLDRLARRLARRQTRGQVLKAAAAAALTLPFARVSSARAASPRRSAGGCTLGLNGGPTSCRRGCFYSSHILYDEATNGCNILGASVLATLLGGVFAAPGIFLQTPHGARQLLQCKNQALASQQAMQYSCLQPDCPGFDPCAYGGPCDSCTAYCNYCPTSSDGYNCCSQPPKDGWSPCCDRGKK